MLEGRGDAVRDLVRGALQEILEEEVAGALGGGQFLTGPTSTP